MGSRWVMASMSSVLRRNTRTISTDSNSHFSLLGRQQQTALLSPAVVTVGSPTFSHAVSSRCFSTTDDDDEEVMDTDLPSILARELAEEARLGSTIMPEELSTLLAKQIEPTWRVVDAPDQAVVRLHKREPSAASGAKVVVSFHCQDTLPPEVGLLDSVLPDEDDGDEEDAAPVRFDVTVTRAGKALVFKCLSEEATAVVEGIVVRREEEAQDDGKSLYEGPDFTDLPEDLQESLTAFVQYECGVDEDVAAFVSMYADYKEQVEYVRWMKGVQSLVT